MTYITGEQPDGCIFCLKASEDGDAENGILLRAETCFVILNAYPYNPGHLMVAPYRHVGAIRDLDATELSDLMTVTQTCVAALAASATPDGFNIGINQGRVAGAGIVDHIHQHVVPRWSGDTNFMTSIGETKVLPELIADTYRRLVPFFRQESESAR